MQSHSLSHTWLNYRPTPPLTINGASTELPKYSSYCRLSKITQSGEQAIIQTSTNNKSRPCHGSSRPAIKSCSINQLPLASLFSNCSNSVCTSSIMTISNQNIKVVASCCSQTPIPSAVKPRPPTFTKTWEKRQISLMPATLTPATPSTQHTTTASWEK